MIIYPAIDLKDKECVRLLKGDFAQKTIYNPNPLSQAKEFIKDGSKYIHIVDLDGAKSPDDSQADIIIDIAKNTNLEIQTGGGIRKVEQVEKLLNNGIKRVIIGSLCVKEKELVASWLEKFTPDNIVLALDVNIIDGIPYIATSGWQESSEVSLWEILEFYHNKGLHILCTDISKDGMLTGCNIELYKEIIAKYPSYKLQASGGVNTLEELKELSALDISGAIVGKAIYENKISLSEAIKSC